MTFQESHWVVITLLTLCFVLMFSFILFKSKLKLFYSKNKTTIINIGQVIGIFLLMMIAFRSILMILTKYPLYWEIIPLHFCRFLLLMISICLIVKKTDWIRYFGLYMIIGAIIAISLADLGNSSFWEKKGGKFDGADSYPFWDFYIIHILGILLSTYFLIVNEKRIDKHSILVSTIFLGSGLLFFFIINWILGSTTSNDGWWSNFWYVGLDKANSVIIYLRFLGPLANWPFPLFVWAISGVLLTAFLNAIYFLLGMFDINWDFKKNKNKFFYVKKSNDWFIFKNSQWKLFNNIQQKEFKA